MKSRLAIVGFGLAVLTARGAAASGPANQPPTLLSDLVDVSPDFHDYANTYYLADALSSFDPATARGQVTWRRNQLVPRIAFNTMEPVLRPFEGRCFPPASIRRTPRCPSRSTSCRRGRCACACARPPPPTPMPSR